MIIELCKGGPFDGATYDVPTVEMLIEWRMPSPCCKGKDIVYRPRSETSEEGKTFKLDFFGYEDTIIGTV